MQAFFTSSGFVTCNQFVTTLFQCGQPWGITTKRKTAGLSLVATMGPDWAKV